MLREVIYNSTAIVKTVSLDAICLRILENKNIIKDEDMEIMYELFGEIFMRALEIIEKDNVELITISGTQRSYFSVQGSSGIYTIYQHINFCPCPMYRYCALKKKNEVMCKHVLACHLAWCMNKYKTRTIPEFVYII